MADASASSAERSCRLLGERKEPLGDVTVQSQIVGKTGEVKADYRLRQRDATWYVIDVTVEGVSIVSSYRTQFQEIIGQGGPSQLLAQLRAKNASGEGLAVPGTAGSVLYSGATGTRKLRHARHRGCRSNTEGPVEAEGDVCRALLGVAIGDALSQTFAGRTEFLTGDRPCGGVFPRTLL